jgi:amidohydrolase
MEFRLSERIIKYLENNREGIITLSNKIHAHPEVGFQEYFALEMLTAALVGGGFSVQQGIAGMPTAFRGEFRGREAGPKLALIAEYDALPGLGHGCGHNIIGAAAVGAALALSQVLPNLAGSVVVLGSPAEETGGGKITMVGQGIFADIDAAMMVHPADRYSVDVSSLAMDALEFTYLGKSAHAAASPTEGRNALDGVIQLFNSLNSLRASLKDGVRINGIISEGGEVPNVIPAKAVARFYVRAKDRSQLNAVVERVLACARGAAEATGTQVEWRDYEPSYDDMVTNRELAKIFQNSLFSLGISQIVEGKDGMGSLDMGNVSRIVPAIHPYIAIGPHGLAAHTPEFAQAAAERTGHQGLITGAKALALTALQLLEKPHLLRQVKEEFAKLEQ